MSSNACQRVRLRAYSGRFRFIDIGTPESLALAAADVFGAGIAQ